MRVDGEPSEDGVIHSGTVYENLRSGYKKWHHLRVEMTVDMGFFFTCRKIDDVHMLNALSSVFFIL